VRPSRQARQPRGQPPKQFAARLHFIPRSIRSLQGAIVRLFRRYFERAHPPAPFAILNLLHRCLTLAHTFRH